MQSRLRYMYEYFCTICNKKYFYPGNAPELGHCPKCFKANTAISFTPNSASIGEEFFLDTLGFHLRKVIPHLELPENERQHNDAVTRIIRWLMNRSVKLSDMKDLSVLCDHGIRVVRLPWAMPSRNWFERPQLMNVAHTIHALSCMKETLIDQIEEFLLHNSGYFDLEEPIKEPASNEYIRYVKMYNGAAWTALGPLNVLNIYQVLAIANQIEKEIEFFYSEKTRKKKG